MSEPSEPDSETIFIRVYSEPDGKVYLFYEPTGQRLEVEPPINQNSLEAAQKKRRAYVRYALACRDLAKRQTEPKVPLNKLTTS